MTISDQIASADGVKGTELKLCFPITHNSSQPFSHLSASFDGKSAANDVPGSVAMMLEQVSNSRGESFRLSGARRREHLYHGCWRGHCCPLSGVETSQEMLHLSVEGCTLVYGAVDMWFERIRHFRRNARRRGRTLYVRLSRPEKEQPKVFVQRDIEARSHVIGRPSLFWLGTKARESRPRSGPRFTMPGHQHL